MRFKCKLRDMVDDLVQLGITEIRMDVTGLSDMIAEVLSERGITVDKYRPQAKMTNYTFQQQVMDRLKAIEEKLGIGK